MKLDYAFFLIYYLHTIFLPPSESLSLCYHSHIVLVGNAVHHFGLLAVIAVGQVACGNVPFWQSPIYVFLSQFKHLLWGCCIVVAERSELRAKGNLWWLLMLLVFIATLLIGFINIVVLMLLCLINCLNLLRWWDYHLLRYERWRLVSIKRRCCTFFVLVLLCIITLIVRVIFNLFVVVFVLGLICLLEISVRLLGGFLDLVGV